MHDLGFSASVLPVKSLVKLCRQHSSLSCAFLSYDLAKRGLSLYEDELQDASVILAPNKLTLLDMSDEDSKVATAFLN